MVGYHVVAPGGRWTSGRHASEVPGIGMAAVGVAFGRVCTQVRAGLGGAHDSPSVVLLVTARSE